MGSAELAFREDSHGADERSLPNLVSIGIQFENPIISSDVANWVVETNGAYVIWGASNSGATGNKANTNFGPAGIPVIKLDASGNKLWEQSYGGASLDSATDLERTDDGESRGK